MIAALPGSLADATSARASAPEREFEAVYRAQVGFVWRNLRRLGVPEPEIEDAAHEVFMVVLRRLPDFDGEAAITTWLYAIVRGVASNRRRGDLRRQRRHAEAPPPGPAEGPAEWLERSQAAATVARFLDTLSAEQREVFEMFEIEGLRAHEVAAALALNVNTVYTRLRAARQRFAAFVAALQRETAGGSHG